MKTSKKLIEVALPLDAINAASVREKSIRHGHPSTLHLWWARRPLAAARAVIFSQMVDDPSAHPDRFPAETAQAQERERLFRIIEQLVQWENTNDAKVLEQAREEIRESWLRTCIDNADHPRAATLFDPDRLPAFHDPFAGGGALPLEAQRLGLEAHASDLNPVAVLINKAMIEIPPRFAGRAPVNPDAQAEFARGARWNGKGAQGLAEDVRYYGRWMRDEAEKRIGHLYPKVEVTEAMAAERPDLKGYVGRKLTVIAWLWARTVKSPNPAFAQVDVPLASTFMLSTKKGKEAWVEPVIEAGGYRFTVKTGAPGARVPEAGASEAGIPKAGVPGNGVPDAKADVPETGASEADVPKAASLKPTCLKPTFPTPMSLKLVHLKPALLEPRAPRERRHPRPTFVIPAKAGIHARRERRNPGGHGYPPARTRDEAGPWREFPLPDVGRTDSRRLHQGRRQGGPHGRAADGGRRRG